MTSSRTLSNLAANAAPTPYTGSSATNTNFPIGTVVLVDFGDYHSDNVNLSGSVSLYLGGSTRFITSGATALTGTWSSRGAYYALITQVGICQPSVYSAMQLFERVA